MLDWVDSSLWNSSAYINAAGEQEHQHLSVVQDTPDDEHDGTETCAVPCETSSHGTVGDTNLVGPCGCIGPEGNCNEEFAGGIVKDLCNRMGNNPVSALAQAGTQLQSPLQRRLQATQQPLQLMGGAE